MSDKTLPAFLPAELVEAVKQVVAYNWDKEHADYQDIKAEDPDAAENHHIFKSLEKLDQWLTEGPKDKPKVMVLKRDGIIDALAAEVDIDFLAVDVDDQSPEPVCLVYPPDGGDEARNYDYFVKLIQRTAQSMDPQQECLKDADPDDWRYQLLKRNEDTTDIFACPEQGKDSGHWRLIGTLPLPPSRFKSWADLEAAVFERFLNQEEKVSMAFGQLSLAVTGTAADEWQPIVEDTGKGGRWRYNAFVRQLPAPVTPK